MNKINYGSLMDKMPGSALFYSARFLKKRQKEAVFAICDFYQTIEKITLEYTDLNVAQMKLNGWRDQVIKIRDGLPDYPLAQTLQKTIRSFALNPLRLLEMIDGLEQNLTLPIFEKFEDVVIHFIRTAGVRELLLAEVVQPSFAVEEIYTNMLLIELVNYLQYLRRYLRKGLVFFSQEELQQFHVTVDDLQKCQTTKPIENLLRFQSKKIERSYQKIAMLKNIPFFMARCRAALAILAAINSSYFKVLENFITITPLKCWWVTGK